jgi:hypothetical protein
MTEVRRFILSAIDPDLGHPAFESMFVVERLEELRTFLGKAADNDPGLELFYTSGRSGRDQRAFQCSL